MHGGSIHVTFTEVTESLLTDLLSNQSEARKIVYDGVANTSGYFANGYYEHRNIIMPAYMANLLSGNPFFVYDWIYNLEKANIAAPDRRVGIMSTPIMEGLQQDDVVDRGIWYRVPLDGSREIMRVSTVAHAWETMFNQFFYFYLLANQGDAVVWDSNVIMNANPHTFGVSWYGGYDNWKTRYKNGSTVVVYDPNNSNHPQRIQGAGGSQFPELPQHAEGGAFAARLLIRHLTETNDYVSNGIYYHPFSFSVNGGNSQSGYREGNNPTGPNSGRLSARGYSNPGQSNIVRTGKDKRPVLLRLDGSKKALVMQNPWASISDVTQFATDKGTFSVRGSKARIVDVT